MIAPYVNPSYLFNKFPSNIGHVKSGMNQGRPRSKTKYFCTPIAHSTARERWKEPLIGEWNRFWNPWLTREWEHSCDRVPIDEWASESLVIARLRQLKVGAVAKASLNRALSCYQWTRSVMSYIWAGWWFEKSFRRSERVGAAKPSDDPCVGVKSLSNNVIAGSPRNSFRASL